MNVREKIESFENLTLIPEATHSVQSLGRERKEDLDTIRTCFMVDRDRIVHCKSFRRLKHKTQVYIKTFGDHYRTRLTHTLEVSQVARSIGVGIGLNENLIEAIALGHDLGHVAFAHNGEEVLNEFLKDGFRHNEQSVRVVKKLEKNGMGLNLTEEVLDGILNHSALGKFDNKSKTLEGRVVKISDKIAYLNHDIDDSIRAGLLKEYDLPVDIRKTLGSTSSERIDTLVLDVINNTTKSLESGVVDISLSKEVWEAMTELRKYMFKNIYLGDFLSSEREKAKFILVQLIEHYCKYPEKLPDTYKKILESEGLERAVADYIAGMSDDYCLNCFNRIFVPKFVIY
ncbi:deoxyguanosinetriphosphate triphosphohydrolase [Clostridium chauvoei]|uniref:Deoxyguanosinetriphosphate triphosphohydrolase n=2 Tax=Clostridium chauvoei TaxID=46867 RepID=A0ABD4RG72_9CLOT|nr:deoxyguanosinetriphosphate triphosphohydrolase [Clostridium chauvoei]ATD54714.1 deoxyguanosinetriphosphate triphosphohydrolase [Clostridium chauvoei]ATD57604.1 deoxyguanosinetriphosphate triphosphohydrolase [Clostridium chauvoei]MBX7280012.1 deoxyguanosinetriphosphate triphosphohydrolase [Clostridium chauvoei]MBX7282329.1 deoxyguanosinetriphosphate triphosphohydrolase [Clostridium chauvoei]MBX7284903.1 deoxyguanosinetriphosphate triphosphohydrolase [Clostridium chauvoei]